MPPLLQNWSFCLFVCLIHWCYTVLKNIHLSIYSDLNIGTTFFFIVMASLKYCIKIGILFLHESKVQVYS